MHPFNVTQFIDQSWVTSKTLLNRRGANKGYFEIQILTGNGAKTDFTYKTDSLYNSKLLFQRQRKLPLEKIDI